jgi:hypothetical protein
MNASARQISTPRLAVSASTYDGFFLRDNLASGGQVPAAPPYNQCPDIIQSGSPIPNAQSTLSAISSWQTIYDCQPVIGAPNYYYLRGMNGTAPQGAETFQLKLFWAPAQLILFPATWKNNPLTAATGGETVAVTADPGHIGVGDEPFLWQAPPAPTGSTFYSLVAQAVGANGVTPPLPTDWIGMSQLLTQQLSVGFRNMVYVDPSAPAWAHQVGVTIPSSVSEKASLRLMVTASGFTGCSLGLIADRFTSEQEMIALRPVQLTDGFTTGIQFTADPGFTSQLTVQCWNPGSAVPAGSTITLLVSALVPENAIADAIRRGALHSRYSRQMFAEGSVDPQVGVGPQPLLPLGTVSFVAGPSPSAPPGP